MLKPNIKVKNESIDVKVKNQYDKLKISHINKVYKERFSKFLYS